MPAQPTLIEELVAAARGSLAVLVGDRRAPAWFDFSMRGLYGSFIALLGAQVIAAWGPVLLGDVPPPGVITRAMIMVAVLFVVQVGFSAILLRQIGRLDGLRPYLVADNWATFFITLLTAVLARFGMTSDVALFATGILVLVMEVNIARLIVTLTGWQVAMFIVAQLVGVSVGLLLIGIVYPPILSAVP